MIQQQSTEKTNDEHPPVVQNADLGQILTEEKLATVQTIVVNQDSAATFNQAPTSVQLFKEPIIAASHTQSNQLSSREEAKREHRYTDSKERTLEPSVIEPTFYVSPKNLIAEDLVQARPTMLSTRNREVRSKSNSRNITSQITPRRTT